MTPEELDELERLRSAATSNENTGPIHIKDMGEEATLRYCIVPNESLTQFAIGWFLYAEQANYDVALRNAAPALLLAARENAALRAENRSLVQTLCDEVNEATEELRARLEAAEKVVEAARRVDRHDGFGP